MKPQYRCSVSAPYTGQPAKVTKGPDITVSIQREAEPVVRIECIGSLDEIVIVVRAGAKVTVKYKDE
jgi:hypothetical protein